MAYEAELPLSEREIKLVETLGILNLKQEILDRVIMCLVVRLGGQVKIDHKEIDFCLKTYLLEKNVRTDDLTADVSFKAHLK